MTNPVPRHQPVLRFRKSTIGVPPAIHLRSSAPSTTTNTNSSNMARYGAPTTGSTNLASCSDCNSRTHQENLLLMISAQRNRFA